MLITGRASSIDLALVRYIIWHTEYNVVYVARDLGKTPQNPPNYP